jgi:hypothetical protein
MLNTKMPRTLATLALPTTVPALIAYGNHVIGSVTNNPNLPNLAPFVATLTTAKDDLETAEAGAIARTKGAVATRNAKRIAFISELQQLKSTVQKAADANPENAPAIIQSAGLAIHKPILHKKRVFTVTQGPVAGSVKLLAPATRRAAYDWQYSTDGGKTWLDLPSTIQAKTTAASLPAATTVEFRFRTVAKAGVTDWSTPLPILVH